MKWVNELGFSNQGFPDSLGNQNHTGQVGTLFYALFMAEWRDYATHCIPYLYCLHLPYFEIHPNNYKVQPYATYWY